MNADILSADGGGIRGYLQALLFNRLETRVPGFTTHPTRLAGASIGGINVLFLAAGFPLSDLLDLYRTRGKDIFKSRGLLDRLTPDELWRADFAHEDIYKVLTDVFGDLRMEDLKREVLIPVFDMRTWNTKFYERDDEGVLVRDVARMTSAAPTYWPSWKWSLDGGLFANNPSDCAIASELRVMRRARGGTASFKHDDRLKITCLSIGTGEPPHVPPSKDGMWDAGALDVIPLLLNVLMDGGVKASDFRAREAINGRYHRLQPKLASAIDLKDVGRLDELAEVAGLQSLDGTVAWIKENWGLAEASARA